MNRRVLGWVLVALLLGAGVAKAAPDAPTEWDVKAAYLYNFTLFVEWPEATMPPDGSPFVVGVVGADPFGGVLDATFAGKAVGTHPVVVRRLASPEEAGAVHVLYIASLPEKQMQRVLRAVQEKPVLTVSDAPDGAHGGVVVAFRLRDSRVRFDVDLTAARRAGLRISSQLLKLALSVTGP